MLLYCNAQAWLQVQLIIKIIAGGSISSRFENNGLCGLLNMIKFQNGCKQLQTKLRKERG